jgi:hypothetical protein
MKVQFIIPILLVLIIAGGCKKKEKEELTPVVKGCMNPNSMNYNQSATQDDGSCQFADKYFPMKTGNTWLLQDTVEVPIPNFELSLPVTLTMTVENDTVMAGKNYFMISQNFEVEGSPIPVGNVLPSTRFGYRTDASGKVFRRVPGDSNEYLYLNYPLVVGDTWEDQSSSGATYTVTGTQLMWVPALGKSVSAWKIQVISTTTGGQPVELYFSKDIGWVRQEISFTIMGFNLGLDAFLQSLALQ